MTEPTDQQRKQAREIVRAWLLTSNPLHLVNHKQRLIERIAVALSSRDTEVREVLEGLATRVPDGLCWCPDAGALFDGEAIHGIDCQRTQTLYTKHQLLPSENPGASLQK